MTNKDMKDLVKLTSLAIAKTEGDPSYEKLVVMRKHLNKTSRLICLDSNIGAICNTLMIILCLVYAFSIITIHEEIVENPLTIVILTAIWIVSIGIIPFIQTIISLVIDKLYEYEQDEMEKIKGELNNEDC